MTGYLPVVGILILAFIFYMAVRPMIFDGVSAAGTSKEGFEYPAPAPLEIRAGPAQEKARRIVSSGPNPPSQAPPQGEIVINGEPAAADPYAERTETADAPENLRHVERSFRPAPDNDMVGLAPAAGIAGEAAQNSPQAYQKYGTDFVQNSGEFMSGVFANDIMSDANFSAF
jgi:hypothetical protein